MWVKRYNVQSHERSIFTIYAIFQNILGGIVFFFNLTVLFRHIIYIAEKLLSIIIVKKFDRLAFLTMLKGFHIKKWPFFGALSLVKDRILGFGLEGFESFKLFQKGLASPSPKIFRLESWLGFESFRLFFFWQFTDGELPALRTGWKE